MKVIGIDIGTTTISLVVLDTEKKAVLESRTVPNGTFIRTEKEWERIQNPDRIVEKAMRELKELRKAYKDVETIGLTSQMHGILYIDEDGNVEMKVSSFSIQFILGRMGEEIFRNLMGRVLSVW